ncbi:hypothetical protein [Telluribacter sp.]|jgi:hypothetical protein|uniref:hypothetical protein n=1 Tax=Telluribacter sp. TaxID=1978767 RepID=UPI002E144860|nr:hypothetical protein [Telluribacter sp.]
MRIFITGVIIFITILCLAEVALRYKFGFLQAPLYVEDPDYEYIYAPNQNVVRFGNRVRTNSFSMRSNPINSSSDTIVILLVGDSVILGGSLSDQDSIASTMLEGRLSQSLNQRIRVLNISAGSWGPDNAAGYLKKFGLFNADLLCLVTSSHDAHDIMGNEPIVGINPNFPKYQYSLALEELWIRYLYPRYFQKYSEGGIHFAPIVNTNQGTGIQKNGTGFNPGYEQLASIAQENNIPFLIYLHPEIVELEGGSYNSQGKEIIQFATDNNIQLIDELELGVTSELYRSGDNVHYNIAGQKFLANQLYPIFYKHLSTKF